MAWILIAISSHFCWAISNVCDKYVVSNRIKNPLVYLVYFVAFGTLSAVLLPFVHFVMPSALWLGWLVAAGIIYFLANILYYQSIQIEEVSRINVWWSLVPLFSLILTLIVSKGALHLRQIIAIGLLVIASVIGSVRDVKQQFAFSPAFSRMVLSCFLLAVFGMIFHYVTAVIPIVHAFIIVNLVMTACVGLMLILKKSVRNDLVEETKALPRNILLFILFIDLVDRAGIFFSYWALSLQQSSLVFAMEATQVLFVFMIVVILSYHNPALLREELTLKNVILKSIALLFMVAGIMVLAFS